VSDELGVNAYCRIGALRWLPLAAYDRRHDVWTLDPAHLSPGCGGPDVPEEIII
jgi:hypothetical protein